MKEVFRATVSVAVAIMAGGLFVAPLHAAVSSEFADTEETLLLCHLDEGQGDVIQDVSKAGKGRTGKLFGAPAWIEGRFAKAVQLDGQDDIVDCGPYHEIFGADPFSNIPAGSVAFWFSPVADIDGTSKRILTLDCCQSPRFIINETGELEVSYVADRWSGDTIHALKSGINRWKADTWYCLLFTWGPQGHALFVDDTPVAKDDLGSGILAPPDKTRITVGCYFNGSHWNEYSALKIDELRITRPKPVVSDKAVTVETTASGITKETRTCRGTITGNVVSYTVHYPAGKKGLPVLFHHYGDGSLTVESNARLAGYGIFCASIALRDSHGGYDLQDYKDAMDDIYRNYADQIDTGNVTIMGVSYGGADTYGMSVHFPYLFDAVVPVFGIADFGYDENDSWYPMVVMNSPQWGVNASMDRNIGDRATYRETRYLVRNAIFGAKNNPYAHYEILHDAEDGVGKPGVQVQQSRRYVAELKRLGYTNFNYTETPKEGLVFPQDERLPRAHWGGTIRYIHGFFNAGHVGLYHFELTVLKPGILNHEWQRPPFRKSGELFVPSFLEVPSFRFDLGDASNNCDEAADVKYDISTTEQYRFEIVPRTVLTKGRLQVTGLEERRAYAVSFVSDEAQDGSRTGRTACDDHGRLAVDIPAVEKGKKLVVICHRI